MYKYRGIPVIRKSSLDYNQSKFLFADLHRSFLHESVRTLPRESFQKLEYVFGTKGSLESNVLLQHFVFGLIYV